MLPKVFLIGAGPGDPGLLTLRGAELLGRCDVVLYDGLSNSQLLAHAPRAELICVGKHGQSRIWRQDEIIDEMLRHAREGKIVARLKGGDPAVFARTAEEAEALRNAGIAFEIVPGITAALAAGSYAGIPITHRRYASAVALVTGHEEPEKDESALDWDALARFPGTLVVYMGVTTAGVWTSALMRAGKPADTPAAILRRCSLPDQQTIHCRLDEVAQQLTPASKMRPPVIVIIGEVTRLAHCMSWFDSRPLFGKTVLVTRSEQQADELAEPLRSLGAEVISQPAIEIEPLSSFDQLDREIARLSEYDYVVFSSRNGVQYFMQRFLEVVGDLRDLAWTKIAVVGPRTAEMLATYHIRADVVAKGMSADSLAESLLDEAPDNQFLLVRASRGPDTLAQHLKQAGGEVRSVVAYSHTDVTQPDEAIVRRMIAGDIDWVTVTSDAIARSVVRLFGENLRQTRLVSLSPGVSQTIHELGFTVAAQANQPTMQSLVEAIASKSCD
jgi:uroporphyrinogen III methyltransferase/synthase